MQHMERTPEHKRRTARRSAPRSSAAPRRAPQDFASFGARQHAAPRRRVRGVPHYQGARPSDASGPPNPQRQSLVSPSLAPRAMAWAAGGLLPKPEPPQPPHRPGHGLSASQNFPGAARPAAEPEACAEPGACSPLSSGSVRPPRQSSPRPSYAASGRSGRPNATHTPGARRGRARALLLTGPWLRSSAAAPRSPPPPPPARRAPPPGSRGRRAPCWNSRWTP